MRTSTTTYELTDLQKQFWYGSLRFGDPGAYTLSVCIRLDDVDPDVVRAAVERVVRTDRLLALRVAGSLEKPLLEPVDRPEALHAFRDVRAAGAAAVEALLEERRRIALDPAVATFDSLLVRTGERELRWFIALHHLLADGWSVKVLVERVAHCCELGSAWRAPEGDSAARIAEWKSFRGSAAYAEDERYWSGRLASPLRPVELYGYRTAGGLQNVRTAVELAPQATQRLLRAAASASPASPTPRVAVANFFAAALIAYLHAAGGEGILSIGIPFSNRRSPSDRASLGLHMQIGILRMQVAPGEPFRALLERVAAESAEVNRHVRLTPANPGNRSYAVMLNVHNVTYPPVAGAAVHEEWLRSGNDTLPFTVHVRGLEAERMRIEIDLQKEGLPDGIRSRVASHFVRVLEQAAADPDRLVADFVLEDPPPLPPPPRLRDGRGEETIEEHFGRVAAERREETAVIWGEASASFAEIDARSAEIRDRLVSLGCPPGGIVAVRTGRSIGAVASILGILRAGAVWLPLDPSYPESLLAHMASDAGACAVVQAPGEPRGPDAENRATVTVDPRSGTVLSAASRSAGARGNNAPRPRSGSPRPAYCLYTSGSTGKPKGVVGSHQAALNRLRWMWRAYPLEEDEVLLQKTSLNFIDSVWEIFGALLAGRPLLIADDEEVRDPRLLAGLAEGYPIRRIILVPTLLRALLAAPGGFPSALHGIRRWFVTGELFPASLARALREAHPRGEIFNLYGTTETYDAACHRVAATDLERRFIPIGGPIDNMQLLVLDDRLRPVAEGLRGELFVRGVGVAHGYLNRSELTARKFPRIDGSPLFRSGDSARTLPGGEIELLGRLDNQVKLRGYRIELEEVEHHLLELPEVGGALVCIDGGADDTADARLAAYLTPANGARLHPRELQRLLRERLPPWMIPSITVVEALPTTPSGKRSHSAAGIKRSGGTPRPAPRGGDSLEARLRSIWRRVLTIDGIDGIGEHENFFDLGGNSLLAVRLAAEIERDLGVRLPLASLFEAPTIRELVDRHLRGARTASSPVAVRLGAAHRTPLFSVPPAGSTVSVFSSLARYLPQDQPLYSFQPKGLERGENPHRSIEEMARDYLREMKEVQPHGPYLLSGRCFGGYVAYEMAQVLAADGEQVAALIIIDSPEAPLEARYQRSHVGVRKLVRYYPKRIAYFIRQGKLLYTVRMKIRNDLSFLAARLLDRLPLPTLDSRVRRLRMLRHLHTLAYHRYVARPYEGRITMLSAGASGDLSEERSRWEGLSHGGIEWHTIPGRHHDLMKEPNIRRVAAKITECLGEVDLDTKNRIVP